VWRKDSPIPKPNPNVVKATFADLELDLKSTSDVNPATPKM
jgi:hypothetical protein